MWFVGWGMKSVKTDIGNLHISWNLDYRVVTTQRTVHTLSPHHPSFRNIQRNRISTSIGSEDPASCSGTHIPSSALCLSCKALLCQHTPLASGSVAVASVYIIPYPTSLEPSDPSQQVLLGSQEGQSWPSLPSISFHNLTPFLFPWKINTFYSLTGFFNLVWTMADSVYSDDGNYLPVK